MKDSYSILELANLLKSEELNKDESEKFLKELFLIIENGLYSDEEVNIEDLGTFELHSIQKEEEVIDFNSQNDITSKCREISFIPDPVLASLVNKPFAHFETVPINDGVEFKDIEKEVIREREDSLVYKDSNYEDNEYLVTKETIDKETEPSVLEKQPDEQAEDVQEMIEANLPKTKSRKLMIASFFVIGVLALGLLIYMYPFKEKVREADTADNNIASILQKDIKKGDIDIKQEQLTPASNSGKTETALRVIKVEEGKTLRLIALKEYGHKEFWIYIYLKNKDIIKDPNVVPVGLTLVLPSNEEYNLNDNTAAIMEAEKIGKEEMLKRKSY